MNKILLFSGLMAFSVFVSSISQVILKSASGKEYSSRLKEYLNFRVGFAYFLFLTSTVISVLALKYIPLSFSAVIEAMGYIYVALLSRFLLNESLNKRQIIGMCIIVVGVITYSLKL